MTARLGSMLILTVALLTPAFPKDKNKAPLPGYVLHARTVLVVIAKDAGEPLGEPNANEIARANVEKALMDWGRFDLVLDGQQSDLVIAVRTGNGKAMRPTVKGGPIDQRPGVAQGGDTSIRIGGQQGQISPPGDPGSPLPNRGPHMGSEIGPSEDTFEVYRGDDDPQESSPAWRYVAKDCLRAPTVSAVEQFRKAVAEAEKPQAQKKP